jgi:hypothetical protein
MTINWIVGGSLSEDKTTLTLSYFSEEARFVIYLKWFASPFMTHEGLHIRYPEIGYRDGDRKYIPRSKDAARAKFVLRDPPKETKSTSRATKSPSGESSLLETEDESLTPEGVYPIGNAKPWLDLWLKLHPDILNHDYFHL